MPLARVLVQLEAHPVMLPDISPTIRREERLGSHSRF
jgi:hypothetical protein